MSQQPYPGGYPQQGYPPQGPPQGYPPQQPQQAPPQGPPQWAGQPQAQPQPGWGQGPQAQQPPMPMQAAVDPTAASGGFFGGLGGGGTGVPSFKWGNKGTGVQGLVKAAEVVENIDYTTKQPVVDEKNGQPAKQLRIELATNLRNWEQVSRIPEDDNGNPKPAHEDDGTRAIYTGGKRSDGQSWMSSAIRDAMRAAGRDPAHGLEIGSLLGVMVEDLHDSGKGNPYRTYVAKYAPVGTHQGLPAPQAQQAAPPQNVTQQPGYGGPPQGYPPQQAPQAPPQQPQAAPQPPQQPGGDPWATYQPQAPGRGLPQPPQGPPAGWGGAPTYDEPPF